MPVALSWSRELVMVAVVDGGDEGAIRAEVRMIVFKIAVERMRSSLLMSEPGQIFSAAG